MQAYVQRSDLNLAREIAPNGKELLGIVLFSKKFELKHEFLYYQKMPDTMQLDCFCSWNPFTPFLENILEPVCCEKR